MIKMPKMQKIPNLFLFVGKDHQLVYFTMLSSKGWCTSPTFVDYVNQHPLIQHPLKT
jgi:hypothetical protein